VAVAKVADRGSTANTTSGATTIVTVTGNTTIGNYIVLRVAVDNSGSSGARPGLTVSDSRVNTWVVGTGGLADPGAANAGTACYIAYCKITVQLITNDTITCTWGSGTPTAKAVVAEEWSGIDPTTALDVAETNTTGSSTAPSISKTPSAAGMLFYACLSVEGPTSDTYTEDADSTNGTWVSLTRAGSGSAQTAQTVAGAYKIVTATGAQSWDPTITTEDWAVCAVVFKATPTVIYPLGVRRVGQAVGRSVNA
jgi:hypothetical protein